jgi:hypothetical protein
VIDKHPAHPEFRGYIEIAGIDHPVKTWGDCLDCGRPVRYIPSRQVFWHVAGKARPDDPRRQQPRRQEWNEAISKGMVAANARRKARRG